MCEWERLWDETSDYSIVDSFWVRIVILCYGSNAPKPPKQPINITSQVRIVNASDLVQCCFGYDCFCFGAGLPFSLSLSLSLFLSLPFFPSFLLSLFIIMFLVLVHSFNQYFTTATCRLHSSGINNNNNNHHHHLTWSLFSFMFEVRTAHCRNSRTNINVRQKA